MSRIGKRRWWIYAVVFVVGALSLWDVWRGPIRVYLDEDRTRASILEQIPIGSSEYHALDQMKRSGFTCERVEDMDIDRFPTSGIYCARPCRDIRAPMASWRVSIFLAGGSVADVVVVFGSP